MMTYERQRAYDIELGEERGIEKKAVEAAIKLIQKYHETPEVAAKEMNAPLEKVLDALIKQL